MRYRQTLSGAALLALAGALTVGAQEAAAPPIFGPGVCLPAQFWNTPGFQPRDGDYGYVRVAPHSGRTSDIQRALRAVPVNSRMLRSSSLDGVEQLLHQLIQVERFQIAALGCDIGSDRTEACAGVEALAHRYGLKFLASVGAAADIARQRAANPNLALFQEIPAGSVNATEPPRRILRDYRANADMVQGLVLSDRLAPAEAGRLLRAIRPQLGLAHAVARDEGPSMYFFNFLWKTPGWQPRAGDYAYVKIRPALKTLDQKVKFVMAELKDIPPEHRKIMLNELAGAAELLHELIDVQHFPIAAMDYDLENWELTPKEEQADPIASCKRGQALADQYHMAFVVVPDMAMDAWAARIAPFVAGLAPQCKGLQVKNMDEAIARQRKLYCEIRRANPDILLYHDLGASPKGVLQTVPGLLHYFSGVADLVDGIEIWSQDTPPQKDVIAKYIIAVRPPWQGARTSTR